MSKVTLNLRGMHCASCANSIQLATRSISGVASSNVNFATEEAVIEFDDQKTSASAIQKVIKDIGYEAILPDQVDGDSDKKARLAENQDLTRKVWVGGVISVVLVTGVLPMMTGIQIPLIPDWLHNRWFQLALALPVQVWCGSSFYTGAWKAFKNHTATMDTLIALGTLAAFSYSVTVTLNPSSLPNQLSKVLKKGTKSSI
jgi:Cu+-exporting ATPase